MKIYFYSFSYYLLIDEDRATERSSKETRNFEYSSVLRPRKNNTQGFVIKVGRHPVTKLIVYDYFSPWIQRVKSRGIRGGSFTSTARPRIHDSFRSSTYDFLILFYELCHADIIFRRSYWVAAKRVSILLSFRNNDEFLVIECTTFVPLEINGLGRNKNCLAFVILSSVCYVISNINSDNFSV